ncbi:riboflavin synthase [Ancylobacter sp. TS-1]|uniref:riboflavin synthase n=1 Tax=Ancylobacter sp. TS-1 TaxID=1850374 RepID=UPI001265C752|nr:riboflavin synthase [Ancylobacter sp. TS-1]QFR32293.1 riboflavin synthase [Ancylobacter sp. TS-1]
MFTGIVTDIGTVRTVAPRNDVRRLTIASRYDTSGIELGASIACAGVCLTVVATQSDAFEVEAAPETLAVTTASGWTEGRRLNLERALKIGDELGGHIVQGHADGIARVIAREDLGETTRFTFEAPADLARFIATKGSITLDGTSLTVNTVDGPRFTCLLIPHTLTHTTWGDVQAGDAVNIEVDMMARYAARLAEFR